MATIVSTLFISLDGVAEIDPAWHFPYFDENMGAAVGEDYEDVDVLLLGRVTYDSFAGAWPDREAAGGEDATFAAQLGDMRKVVATRGGQDLGWRNAEAVQGDLVEAVTALKADPAVGKILVAGSISIVRQLLAAGLVDQLACWSTPSQHATASGCSTTASPSTPCGCCAPRSSPPASCTWSTRPASCPAAAYDDVTDKVPGADG